MRRVLYYLMGIDRDGFVVRAIGRSIEIAYINRKWKRRGIKIIDLCRAKESPYVQTK